MNNQAPFPLIMSHNRRVTIADVAARVGLTNITVSRALNRPEMVKPETRARIETVARELGYVPNAFARGLKHSRSRLIGLVTDSVDNPFYSEMIKAISRDAKRHNYAVLLFDTDGEPWLEANAIETLLSYQAAGIILSPISDQPGYRPAYIEQLYASEVAVVQLDRTLHEVNFSAVVLDNIQAGQWAARYLLDHVFNQAPANGHFSERLLVAAGPEQSLISRQRLAYVRDWFASSAPTVTVDVLWGDYTLETALNAVGNFIDRYGPPSAIFGLNQLIMLGALRALKSRGQPWDSLGLISIDRLPYIDIFDISVPCVVHDGYRTGEQALSLLMEHIDEPRRSTRTITIQGELVG